MNNLPSWAHDIDWVEYRRHKQFLAEIVDQQGTTSGQQRNACLGTLALLDALQDWAEEHGADVKAVASDEQA